MFLADVGQNRVEEIDIMDMSHAGRNYGWAIYEGNECYNNDDRCVDEGNITTNYLYFDNLILYVCDFTEPS